MITIKNITLKNFMSTGNITQAVVFNENKLTLVLGNNVDLGGDGSRNGTGKTSLINALSFALYGKALTQIRKDNLVNKTNSKHMMVTVEFEKNGTSYRIERGRKPNIFRFFVDGTDLLEGQEETDEAQGENRITQHEIEKVLGMSHDMFKHTVALNTYTQPFLAERAAFQKDLIEELFGISQLSEKAENLKIQVKNTKELIKEEEYRIKASEESNQHIQKTIDDMRRRKRIWEQQKEKKTEELTNEIDNLENIDITQEIQAHQDLKEFLQHTQEYDTVSKELTRVKRAVTSAETTIEKLYKELEATKEHKCYACGSELHDEKHEQLLQTKQEAFDQTVETYEKSVAQVAEYESALAALGKPGKKPITYYNSESDAYSHQSKLESLHENLRATKMSSDPYQDQIENLEKEGLNEISWDTINTLSSLQDHQDFLLKLLTNKDSFIRKKIIEQNLFYLNAQLGYYLNKLGLPHDVEFMPDLSVEITELGRDLDFDNLSRGERSRLILGLSFAFRDVHESMNNSLNFLVVDELMDNGLDPNGVESSLGILKSFARERSKNIFLISHKEELLGRVNNILDVIKENGFTEFHQQNPGLEVLETENDENDTISA